MSVAYAESLSGSGDLPSVVSQFQGVALDEVIFLDAHTETSPPTVFISGGDGTYYRRAVGERFFEPRSSPDPVEPGVIYEYRAGREFDFQTGTTASGVDIPLQEDRGRILLVMDESIVEPLGYELDQLEQDLVGDGWKVDRVATSRSEEFDSIKVRDTKAVIRSWFDTEVQARAVYLIGRVPVPYSGSNDLPPDGHNEHRGAWPADPFYGDMDGDWKDVDFVGGENRNLNVPDDGKYDHYSSNDFDDPDGVVELEVGRVDFFGMDAFGLSELELLRQYLDKVHRYKHKQFTAQSRGLIDYNFDHPNLTGASSAYRNFYTFWGPGKVDGGYAQEGEFDLKQRLSGEDYQWAYGDGPGSNTSAGGVVRSHDFIDREFRALFWQLFGSYFGDWDTRNNLLRAPLTMRDYGLSSNWGARPRWQYHHMVMGETLGFCARLSMNQGNAYGRYTNWSGGFTYMALHGDPSLRLHIVAPVVELEATKNETGIDLRWEPSPDASRSAFRGYHVYRSTEWNRGFTRLTESPLEQERYHDASPPLGEDIFYMVRAIAEESRSGVYMNASQGILVGVLQIPENRVPNLVAYADVPGEIELSWEGDYTSENGIIIQRKNGEAEIWETIERLPAGAVGYVDSSIVPEDEYHYRVREVDISNSVPHSNVVSVTAAKMPHILELYEGFDYEVGEKLGNQNSGRGWSAPWTRSPLDESEYPVPSMVEIMPNSLSAPLGYSALTTGGKSGNVSSGVSAFRVMEKGMDLDKSGVKYFSFLISGIDASVANRTLLWLYEDGGSPSYGFRIGIHEGTLILYHKSDSVTFGHYPGDGSPRLIIGEIKSRPGRQDDQIRLKAYTAAESVEEVPLQWDLNYTFRSISRINAAFLQFSLSSGCIDEIRMGTTFESVTKSARLVGLLPWLLYKGVDRTFIGPDDDWDGDSLTNLQEYALNLNPLATDEQYPAIGYSADRHLWRLFFDRYLAATDVGVELQAWQPENGWKPVWNSQMNDPGAELQIFRTGDHMESLTLDLDFSRFVRGQLYRLVFENQTAP